MRFSTTPLALAAGLALGRSAPALAQNTPDENNPNWDAPFVRHIRPDRPGLTVTAGVLRPGQFQLELGAQRLAPNLGQPGSAAAGLLRIGFFNSLELRVSQGYVFGRGAGRPADFEQPGAYRPDSVGWAPLRAGTKLMLTPDRAARFQVSLLAEADLPGTGARGLQTAKLAPAGRLLVSQQLGQRFGLEANFGYRQTGLTAADAARGQLLGTLALNGPLGDKAGFFVEGYRLGRGQLTSGLNAGLYCRPWTGLRLDATAGRTLGGPVAGSATLGLGLSLRLGQ